MAIKGPRSTPTAILEKRGSWRAKTRQGEPIPQGDFNTTPPEKILNDPEALACWNEIVPILQNMGIITIAEWRLIIRYCRFWSVYYSLMDDKKRSRMDECYFERAACHLLKIERELGFTPSSRAGIRVPEKEKKDKYIKAV